MRRIVTPAAGGGEEQGAAVRTGRLAFIINSIAAAGDAAGDAFGKKTQEDRCGERPPVRASILPINKEAGVPPRSIATPDSHHHRQCLYQRWKADFFHFGDVAMLRH